MAQNAGKFYPQASSEIAKLLGLERDQEAPAVMPKAAVPTNVPTYESTAEIVSSGELRAPQEEVEPGPGPSRRALVAITGVLPYLAVFAVGILVYYVYLADPSSRPDFLKREEISMEEQERAARLEAYEQLKKDESKNYLAWIGQFYFDISDTKVIAPDEVANNGLTNFENYLLQLNPKNYDTLQNGKSDAENVLDGINPKTGAPLTDAERDVIAKYFNRKEIEARIHFTPAGSNPGAGQSAGAEVGQANEPVPPPSPTGILNSVSINTEIPGRLEIPTIAVNVPIIWTKDSSDFDSDLRLGVVHYPGTPLPGDLGTSYISGHSSNFAWINADFNRVFARLNELQAGATVKITVVGSDGKNIFLHYVINHKQIFKPNDQAQFSNYAESVIALSTCWPINTNDERLVAYAKLDRITR